MSCRLLSGCRGRSHEDAGGCDAWRRLTTALKRPNPAKETLTYIAEASRSPRPSRQGVFEHRCRAGHLDLEATGSLIRLFRAWPESRVQSLHYRGHAACCCVRACEGPSLAHPLLWARPHRRCKVHSPCLGRGTFATACMSLVVTCLNPTKVRGLDRICHIAGKALGAHLASSV